MKTAFTRFRRTLIVVLAAGCAADELVSPSAGPVSLAADFVPVPGGTVTLPIPDQTTPVVTVALPALGRRTLLRVTVTGTVEISQTPYNTSGSPGLPSSVGPPGFYWGAGNCGAQVHVGYGSYGGGTTFATPCASDGSTNEVNSTEGFIFSSPYSGSAIRSGGTPGTCYESGLGYGPCFYYSTAGQTVTLEKVTAEFDLTAAPTTVNYNDTVTVTASITPAQVGSVNVPWTIDSVRWTPAFGTQNSPCGWNLFVPNTGDAPSRTCRRPFTRSGTLTVSATVNGDVKQKAVTITVTPPQLDVTASPASIPGAQAVTFTAAVTPSSATWNVSSWTWRPDSGAVGSGISPSNCGWTEKVCTRTILKSGWMKATATVGEYTLKDSAHVGFGNAEVRIRPTSGSWNVRPAGTGGTATLDLEVSVVDANGQPLPNRGVALSLTATEGTGGHVHVDAKPAGGLSGNPVNTGTTGLVVVSYTTPAPSGPVAILGVSSGARDANETINVLVEGLQGLGSSSYYGLIGATDEHPDNHYGTPAFNGALGQLAGRFYNQFGQGLEFNDMSLVLGGIFDLNTNWQSPHGEHKIGLNLDLRTITLTEAQLDFVELVWLELSSVPDADAIHEETTPPHWHLRY